LAMAIAAFFAAKLARKPMLSDALHVLSHSALTCCNVNVFKDLAHNAN